MKFSDMISSSQAPVQAPTSPSVTPPLPPLPQGELIGKATMQPHYKKEEITKEPEPHDGVKSVLHHSKTYADARGWSLCLTIFEAMDHRRKGERFLSYREADIAARGKTLDEEVVVQALMHPIDHFLTEGLVGEKENAYELRRLYNRGVEYKRTKYAEQPPEQKKKCDDYMTKLVDQLTQKGFPPWPEEIVNGFHPNLCRPEYMTEKQYQDKIQNYELQLVEWQKAS